jgi:hypothetical protein
MQVTVDAYGHLIPGANVNWVDRLNSLEADLPPSGALQDVSSVRLVYKPQKLGIKRTGTFGVTNTGSPRRFLVPPAHNAPRSNPSPR